MWRSPAGARRKCAVSSPSLGGSGARMNLFWRRPLRTSASLRAARSRRFARPHARSFHVKGVSFQLLPSTCNSCGPNEKDASEVVWSTRHLRKENAVSEDRTHDLRIMRPTRCQLRYHRSVTIQVAAFFRTERWLRGCACQQKVASSIPQCCRGVRAFFPGFRRCRFR